MNRHQLTVLTNSAYTCARRCEQEFYISYVLGYRPVEDRDELRFGTIIHKGLEVYWLGRGIEAAIVAACAGAIDAFEAVKVEVLLRGYEARWGAEHLDQVVAVEREFWASLVNPDDGTAHRRFDLGGKMDVLLQRAFVEHKTTSEDITAGSFYWRRLRLNSQVSTYYAGAQSLGYEPERCIYDVIRKPTIRPTQIPLRDNEWIKIVLDAQGERVYCKATSKKAEPKPRETGDAEKGYVLQTRPETAAEYGVRLLEHVAANPDHYYARGDVVRLEHEQEDAQRDMWQRAEMIAENLERNRWPKNPDACLRYGKPCAYFDYCCGVASLEDASRFVRLENPHAELAAEPAAA